MLLYMIQQRAKELILVKNGLSGKVRKSSMARKVIIRPGTQVE